MIHAKKSLGQNFLTNAKVAESVADVVGVTKGDMVLEVGPGRGMLTQILLAKGAYVIAIEKDQRLTPLLREKFKREIVEGQLILHEGDILTSGTQKEILKNLGKNYKIAANIPYYITGKLIRLFLTFAPQPQAIGLLLQKEVAERIIAKERKESVLSISVKAYGDPKYVKTVARGNFSPTPNVDSAVLAIKDVSRDTFKNFSEEDFFKLVRAGFSHKRKYVRNNILKLFPDTKLALDHVSEKARAEDLTLLDWKKILQ